MPITVAIPPARSVPARSLSATRRDRTVVALGAISGGAILLAFAHGMTTGAAARGLAARTDAGPWLALHLLSVIPALPLGGYVLWRRKGDAGHRVLGRIWAGLMLMAALSSFGLKGMTGGLSFVHLLSILVLVMIPRGVMQAVRHDVGAHRRTMSLTYLGLAAAGFFTLLPGRLIGGWLTG